MKCSELFAVIVVAVLAVGCRAMGQARAQAPADSIAAWAEQLRGGELVDRVAAAGKLAAEKPGRLPPDVRRAVVYELRRINEALLYRRAIEGLDELGPESFGEYHLDLSTMAAAFANSEADRALILSVGVSRGVQRRVARLGDDAVPLLVEMIERDYQAADALETLALAWYWADSTAAPLTDASRSVILEQLVSATRSDRYGLRRAAAAALALTGDPGFAPLAERFRSSAKQAGERLIVAALDVDALPALAAAAAGLSAEQLAGRSRRLLALICKRALDAAKSRACQRVEDQFDAALDELRGARVTGARLALEAAAEAATEAAGSGTLSADELALVAGGAQQVLARLE